MELNQREIQIAIMAISCTIQKELQALDGLKTETHFEGITRTIEQRKTFVNELDRLREKLRKKDQPTPADVEGIPANQPI